MNNKIIPIAGIIIAVIIIIIDHLTKGLVLINVSYNETIKILPILNIVFTLNQGISFGLFGDAAFSNIIFTIISMIITLFLILFLLRNKSFLISISLGFIIGGAIGNLYDRVRLGAVVDFIQLHYHNWHFPAFNIADSAIFIGVFLFIISEVKAKC